MLTDPGGATGRPSRQKLIPIVGAYFRAPAEALLALLPHGTPLRLERDPGNRFDESGNAVKVMWDYLDYDDWHRHLADTEWPPVAVLEFYKGLPAHFGFVPNSEKTGGRLADLLSPGLLSGEVNPHGTLGAMLEATPQGKQRHAILVTISPNDPPRPLGDRFPPNTTPGTD
jgi:hypothetical protein